MEPMSGPGLKKVDSHAAIHEAALNEARELTDMIKGFLDHHQSDKALEVAYITVEHWESRTLAHADSEEAGLYKELVKASPESTNKAVTLTRDHDLLRRLVAEIKEHLSNRHIGYDVLHKFNALIEVDHIHNEDEEQWVSEVGEL